MLVERFVNEVFERRRDRRPSPFFLWMAISIVVHLAFVATYATWGGSSAWRGPGRSPGPGGDTVEVSFAGPVDGTLRRGSSEASRPEATPVPAIAPEQEAPPEPPVPDAIPIPRRRPRPAQRERPAAGNENSQRREPVASPSPEQAAGTGTPETHGGGDDGGNARQIILGATGALGSGAAADALGLEGSCADPVAGTWRAQKYRSTDHTWVRFTLRILRLDDRLSGTIESRIWSGTPSNPVPGECTAFGHDQTWLMRADGRVEGESVRFDARSLRLMRDDCPSSGSRYAPDHFSGTVQGEAYNARNNDGNYDIDEPYLFRRVSCE